MKLDTLLHRWLRVPYVLHVRHNRRPKRPQATAVFIHGIGNSGESWRKVIARLDPRIRVVTVDLLGFGDSPQPAWSAYDAKRQAQAVHATLLKLRLGQPLFLVGHSLGALVAVEVARRYPRKVQSLILCSPPFYDTDLQKTLLPKNDALLRQLFSTIAKRPKQLAKLTTLATKYKLVNEGFNVTDDNIETFTEVLRSAIINQSAYRDIRSLSQPVRIIRGRLDPFVVPKNLKELAKEYSHISLKSVSAAHEIKGVFVDAVVDVIETEVKDMTTVKRGVQ